MGEYKNMTDFGKEFDDVSYYYENEKQLWLSLIVIRPEYRNKGVLTRLLKDIKTRNKTVIIPEPSAVVLRVALKQGYIRKVVEVTVPSDEGEEMLKKETINAVVWEVFK